MTDDQHPDDTAADRPSTHGDPGMPAAGRRPADRPPAAVDAPVPPRAGDGSPAASGDQVPSGASAASGAAGASGAEVPLDPHAPLSADGPTVRLSKAALMPPGDSAPTPAADAGETGREPAERPGTGADEPTVVSRPAGRDDEATTLLTPPPAADDRPAAHDDELSVPGNRPAAHEDEPAVSGGWSTARDDGYDDDPVVPGERPALLDGEPAEQDERHGRTDERGGAEDEPAAPASRDGGSTMRLQPPFFAPGTTRTPRAKPVLEDRDGSPAGPFDEAVESRERWGSSPATPGSWMDSPAWPDDRTTGNEAGADRDTPERWQDNLARAAAAADERTARETPNPSTREPVIDDRIPPTGSDEAGPGAGSVSAASWSGEDRTPPDRSPDAVTDQGGAAQGVPEKVAPWRRLSSAGALIWVLLALLGFTLVVQLQSNDDDAGLATARQEDLVGILSDLEARDQRLQQEINALEESQRQLTSGVAGRQAALAEAGKRADELGLLSGTLPARGPGLKITIDPKGAPIKASAILNAVQELRGAGGEVMEIIGDNGVAARIVASSYFVDADGGQVIVDGKQLSGPYTVWVIGVPATMQTALQIPGGVVASVSQAGGNVTMEQRSTVEVTAVRQPTSLQYARPVS